MFNRMALDAWVRALSARGSFGIWCWGLVKGKSSKVMNVITEHAKTAGHSEPLGEALLLGCFSNKN